MVWGSSTNFNLHIRISGLILGLCPANERRRYKVTPSFIGWAQIYNQPYILSITDVQGQAPISVYLSSG